MHSWKTAGDAWMEFLDRVERARRNLHCSKSSAWFRGHIDSNWDLTPSLMRQPDKLESDRKKLVNIVGGKIQDNKRKLAEVKNSVAEMRPKLQEAKDLDREIYQGLLDSYRAAQQQQTLLEKERAELKNELEMIMSVHFGERDAFVDWSFRAGKIYGCSWEALAEMQHYHVPTRLLDWTESLAVALYFALENYFIKLDALWNLDAGIIVTGVSGKRGNNQVNANSGGELEFKIPEGLPKPCIWILNPYHLSRKARGEDSILDPTIDKRDDYFESFFVNHNWRYKFPIPIYSPWRNPRIASQSGMFTVHGRSKKPLNEHFQGENDILAEIDIEPEVAVYGVKHLWTFFGMDHFSLFRDLDALGKRVREKFIVPNKNIR